MSHLLKLLVCAIFIGSSFAENYSVSPIPHSDCPRIDDLNHVIMLPYPQDCSKYYSCLNGYAYLQQCPHNLQWSTLTYRCDYPEIAKCEQPLMSSTPSIPPLITPQNTGKIMYQLYPQDCTKYCKCQAMACPVNYFWNNLIQRCDFPHRTQCPYNEAIQQPNFLASTIQFPINVGEIIFQEYPNDCGKFYRCEIMTCPLYYHWNSLSKQCSLPQFAFCPFASEVVTTTETNTAIVFSDITAFTAPPTPAISLNTTTASGPCIECVQLCENSLYQYRPYPNDCHKFVQCNGLAFIHTCPDNLFWNALLNTCDRYCVLN